MRGIMIYPDHDAPFKFITASILSVKNRSGNFQSILPLSSVSLSWLCTGK